MTPAALRSVLAPNPSPMTLDGTRTYIVGRRRPVVIDPGPAVATHVQAVLSRLEGQEPVAIVLTHTHEDHAGAAAELSRASGGPVLLSDPSRLAPGSPSAFHLRLRAEEGDIIESDAGSLRIVATPGHAPDHIALVWRGEEAPPDGAAFVGDLLMGEGDTTLVAPPEGNLAEYLRSLDKLRRLGLSVLYPAHGPALQRAGDAIDRYTEHRRIRIDQVGRALSERPDIPLSSLVQLVYGDGLDPRLRRAAEGSLQALVRYLQRPD
ncbi:MAG: MBL fold metallo-hydrolase [Gemmatimonadota bacterium]